MPYQIVRHEAFSDVTFLWEVEAPDVAAAAQPGHFVMLRLHEGSERIPLTVADFDRKAGTITMVVQALGKTTREMAANYRTGDTFADFVGPLGLAQHVSKIGKVLLVGGGLGIAPVYPQLRGFKEAGNHTTGIIGFRTKSLMFWEDKFKKYCDNLIVCTDDGSYGKPGFVTVALKEQLEKEKFDLVVAIGPLPMMNACVETTRPFGVKTLVSLNSIMVDGTGMCGSCRVTVGGKVQFACVDGPDFDGHQVDFKELLTRQKRFNALEKRALEDYTHICGVEKQLFLDDKRNYKKIKDLAPKQTHMPERDALERSRNFKEVNLGYSLQDALGEANRCIQCLKPTCIAGCPVQIDIPRFIRHIIVRDIDGAADVIKEANAFPSICGRVCPQEKQCEAQCLIRTKVEGVGIGRLERFVGDNAKPKPVVAPKFARKLGKVAICGSGPSGLACAADLAKYGCDVTIFEALHVVGGVLMYGIPSFRLPREIIQREVKGLTDMGVKIETNKVIGKTFSVPQLFEKGFDAVFLGVGAGAPMFLNIPGENASQVYSANEFLTRVNLMGGEVFPLKDTPITIGKSVVVVGAGNTAMDCLRVSKRLGAPTVRCVYRRSEAEAPARVEELRHAKEEGIEFFFLHTPVEIHSDANGNVTGCKVEECVLGDPDEKGRRKPMPTGRFKELECDTMIIALGTKANPVVTKSTPGLGLTKYGNIAADDGKLDSTQATNLPGVFAGGDIVSGGATVILAMGAGRRAAKSIATYLAGGKKWPITAADVAAFQPPTPLLTAASFAAAGVAEARAPMRTCPKCRQTVEGDEEYVCCGTAMLQWKCKGCGKVSDGFAFPYGQCPACGGTLQLVAGDRKLDDAAALDAIRGAFEIELGGMAFYERAAKETKDAGMRHLFGKFAEMEREHMATLTRRYHAQVPAPSPKFKVEHAAIYAGVENQPKDPENLFRIAIAFEKRAVKFFEERVQATKAGSVERELYKELAAEEREHVDLLSTELERWKQGKPGIL